jgi:hypothetical protein
MSEERFRSQLTITGSLRQEVSKGASFRLNKSHTGPTEAQLSVCVWSRCSSERDQAQVGKTKEELGFCCGSQFLQTNSTYRLNAESCICVRRQGPHFPVALGVFAFSHVVTSIARSPKTPVRLRHSWSDRTSPKANQLDGVHDQARSPQEPKLAAAPRQPSSDGSPRPALIHSVCQVIIVARTSGSRLFARVSPVLCRG